jgi:tRNA(Ile)-lysidine synthase
VRAELAELAELAEPAEPAEPASGQADQAERALVLVACSGGADSLALAAGTGFVAARAGLRAGAVVVDHGWFAGSAQVAQQAADTCRALGLDPVLIVPAGPAAAGSGPEAGARAVRYAALDAVGQVTGAAVILLGHTLDDQAETVLLGLARGSGARSLAGMPVRRGRYRRPLLRLPRITTVACCAALGLTPWSDPANTDPAYTRSRLRAVLPLLESTLGPGFSSALARTADQLREDAEALETFAADLLSAARVDPGGAAPSDSPAWDCELLAAAPDAVRRRALLGAARLAGSPAGALSRRHALAVDALVIRWKGQGAVHLPGGVVATRACGRLELSGPRSRLASAAEVEPEQE